MKINFILPPSGLTGGPLAILEYANRFIDKGHQVTVTTYPTAFWPPEWVNAGKPFPWFNFKGNIIYKKSSTLDSYKIKFIRKFFLGLGGEYTSKEDAGLRLIINELMIISSVMAYVPECDLNIATFWSTAFTAYLSKKGKPVYFMQHYEEVFYENIFSHVFMKLLARASYELPIYKIANSSWLQKNIFRKFGQEVPFSNNALELNDFAPEKKFSQDDGVIRIITFSRPEQWKGFADATAAMRIIKEKYKEQIEWIVFGRSHTRILPNNTACPYTFFSGLPFKELAKLYAQCDIAICASWYESFPLPPLEAMASGTAVVTTSDGMEDYAINNVNCLVVKPRDINAMVAAIEQLIDDQTLRQQLVENGLKTAAKYNWNNAVDTREKILKDIYDGNVSYNIYEGLKIGLTDGFGIPFEEMPSDICISDGAVIENDGKLYLIDHGSKRHISTFEIYKLMFPDDTQIVNVDMITFERIPQGMPILNIHDL